MRLRDLLLAGAIAAAAYFAIFGGEYSLIELRRLARETEAEAARVAELRAEIERLQARADSLESDPAALERIARERYGMIRDGERLYRFVGAAADTASTSAARTDDSDR